MEKGGIIDKLSKIIMTTVAVGTLAVIIIQIDFSASPVRGNISGIAGFLRAAWAVILTVKIPLGILTLSAIVFLM
jgi:hypothetical protein